jgi:hypothetical protein
MIEDGFDARTLVNMNVALERVCQRRPDGEDHKVRRRAAQRIIQCKSGLLSYSGPHAFSASYLFYSAAPPLDNSRYRFENVASAATGKVGLLGNEMLPRCSARLRQ